MIVFTMLGIEPKASPMLGKHSFTDGTLHLQHKVSEEKQVQLEDSFKVSLSFTCSHSDPGLPFTDTFLAFLSYISIPKLNGIKGT
jgi:hypothetical protein